MKKCETCKHWGPIEATYGAERLCEHPKLSSRNDPVPADGAQDCEAYDGIYTGPEFGCIHHQSKSDAPQKTENAENQPN